MAGSRKFFIYTTDSGDDFAMDMDESNGEAVGNIDLTPGNIVPYKVPGNIKKRYSIYRSIDGFTSRKIYHSTAATAAAAPATITVIDFQAGTTIDLNRTSYRGESQQFQPVAADTALLDGDAD
jgi:hypothetical protein